MDRLGRFLVGLEDGFEELANIIKDLTIFLFLL